MKRKLICVVMAMLALMSVTACDGDSSTTDSAANNTTKQTTTTKETTTTKKTYYMSESQAISLAKSYIKDRFSQYSPVVIGEVKAFSETDNYWQVSVKGHYWKTDKYGNNAKSQNFYDQVTINKSTGRCKGLA